MRRKDELIKEFGEKRYLDNPTVHNAIERLSRGHDPIAIINELCYTISDIQSAFDKYIIANGKPPDVLVVLDETFLTHNHKRYLVLAWNCYYPSGGLYDFKESFDTLEEAQQFDVSNFDFSTIYDRLEGVEIEN